MNPLYLYTTLKLYIYSILLRVTTSVTPHNFEREVTLKKLIQVLVTVALATTTVTPANMAAPRVVEATAEAIAEAAARDNLFIVVGLCIIFIEVIAIVYLVQNPAKAPEVTPEVPSALPEEQVMLVSPETPVIFDNATILDKVASSPPALVNIVVTQYLMLGFVVIMLILIYYVVSVLAPPPTGRQSKG